MCWNSEIYWVIGWLSALSVSSLSVVLGAGRKRAGFLQVAVEVCLLIVVGEQ